MDTLISINVFRQVVESGSFVAAAERLNLSTAMTTKHIMHLEKRLGTRLLNRNSRSLSLTEPGRLYLERCKIVLAELEEAELAVGSINGAPRGTLRITCPSWFATHQMADLLAAHRRRYPDVMVDVSFEDRLVDLVEEGYDLALRATLSPTSGWPDCPSVAVSAVHHCGLQGVSAALRRAEISRGSVRARQCDGR